MCFEADQVLWSLLCYWELKRTTNYLQVVHFPAFWSRCKILACEVQACAESKISRLKKFKSDTAVLTFTFHFLSSLFFHFSCLICFSFAGHLVGFILVGKVFRKAFRILGLDERKGRWVVEQDFHGNFLILVWFERSLYSVHVSGQSCPWPLKLMTSQAVEGTWICTGGYGWLRGKCVNGKDNKCHHTMPEPQICCT